MEQPLLMLLLLILMWKGEVQGSGNGMIIFCFSGLILIPDIVRSHSSWKI
jgi:hypothetical protein